MAGQFTGIIRVFKDEKGLYRTAIARKEVNAETGEEIVSFRRMLVGFKRGLPEVKNRAKIDIKNGFITWFPMEIEENGEKVQKTVWKIMITEFELVEEGIDEVETSYSNKANKTKNPNDYSSFVINENEYGDDLPF